jgi:hypothetical protein
MLKVVLQTFLTKHSFIAVKPCHKLKKTEDKYQKINAANKRQIKVGIMVYLVLKGITFNNCWNHGSLCRSIWHYCTMCYIHTFISLAAGSKISSILATLLQTVNNHETNTSLNKDLPFQ